MPVLQVRMLYVLMCSICYSGYFVLRCCRLVLLVLLQACATTEQTVRSVRDLMRSAVDAFDKIKLCLHQLLLWETSLL